MYSTRRSMLATHLRPGAAVQTISLSSCQVFSLHFFPSLQILPTFHPPLSASVSLTRRMLYVLRLPAGYWPDSSSASSIDWARACAQLSFLPTHWSTQLVHSPTCPSSEAEPHCCQIHPNPSRLIAVEWDPENSLTTGSGTSGHQ